MHVDFMRFVFLRSALLGSGLGESMAHDDNGSVCRMDEGSRKSIKELMGLWSTNCKNDAVT